MGAEQHIKEQAKATETQKEVAGKATDACPNLGITFDRSALSAVQLGSLDRNGKETVLTLAGYFGKDLPSAQKELFQKSLTDALTDKVSSLAKLALPENSSAAKAFIGMMGQAGFDISVEHGKDGSTNVHSLNIFEHNSNEGMRLNSVQPGNGAKAEFCQTLDPLSRSRDGRVVSSTHDFQSIITTQKSLSDRMKNFLDRD